MVALAMRACTVWQSGVYAMNVWLKILLTALAIAAMSWCIHLYNQSIRDDQRAIDVAEYNVKLIAAQEDARAQEEAWRKQQLKEREKTNELLDAKDAQYATAINTIGGLRNTIANIGNGLPSITIAACSARIKALSTIFNECTEQLGEMGRAAQGQFIDAVSCREQWPISQ